MQIQFLAHPKCLWLLQFFHEHFAAHFKNLISAAVFLDLQVNSLMSRCHAHRRHLVELMFYKFLDLMVQIHYFSFLKMLTLLHLCLFHYHMIMNIQILNFVEHTGHSIKLVNSSYNRLGTQLG